ncbi:cbb3-type cytochrome c oxidase subunit 3 [Paracoccus sp. PAR01]|uniref:cbb3-type cytochrome c oxidase subunit 3 n=1 Tax=Paracoccus sp. PAR01 TaxID=2769282 RepID=UPI00178563C1|nr:cbb3-type cytochrome c oxidase subunit 3 [Paracoccus sp. PAR01]MBD9525387.1 cbb3-type cytochrome c oxidase subunit 3 [Paracoccus sp. PAR01]
MEHYSFLRQLADSWVLVVLVLFFVGTILFAWRPGSRPLHRDAAESIFRNEKSPALEGQPEGPEEVK